MTIRGDEGIITGLRRRVIHLAGTANAVAVQLNRLAA
jgi:hypothetical protein